MSEPIDDAAAPFRVGEPVARGDAATVTLTGELDMEGAPALEEGLRVAESMAPVVVVDARALTFIDSTGLRTIVDCHERSTRAGGRGVEIVVDDGPVRRALDLTGIAAIIPVREERDRR